MTKIVKSMILRKKIATAASFIKKINLIYYIFLLYASVYTKFRAYGQSFRIRLPQCPAMEKQ